MVSRALAQAHFLDSFGQACALMHRWCAHLITGGTGPSWYRAQARRATSGGDTVSAQERTDLGFAIAAVTTQRAQRGELSSSGPTRHRLGVDSEQGCDFGRRQESVAFSSMVGHGSSDDGSAMSILRHVCDEQNRAREPFNGVRND